MSHLSGYYIFFIQASPYDVNDLFGTNLPTDLSTRKRLLPCV